VPWQPGGQTASRGASNTAQPASPERELFHCILRPHLEYCVWFLDPPFKKDVKVPECVQRKVTKLVTGLEGMACEEQLRNFSLSNLRKRG